MKRFDKLWTLLPPVCAAPTDVLKSNTSGFVDCLNALTPLNPLTQPVKEVVPIPVYVMISSSILRSPYRFGYPFVLSTKIVSENDWVSVDNPVNSVNAAPTYVCNFVYRSKFSETFIDPPWNSWEI